MKNRNRALSSLWSAAIVLAVIACIFSLIFAALTGGEKSEDISSPTSTQEVTDASAGEDGAPETEEPAGETEAPAEDTTSPDDAGT